jgi:hypothetical protein
VRRASHRRRLQHDRGAYFFSAPAPAGAAAGVSPVTGAAAGAAESFFASASHFFTSSTEIIIRSAMSWAVRPIFRSLLTMPQLTCADPVAAPARSRMLAPATLNSDFRILEPPWLRLTVRRPHLT